MNAAKSTCPGCHKDFTHRGLSQHIAKTNHELCHAVYAGFQHQSRPGSHPYEHLLLTLTPNSTSWGHPDWSFSGEEPSGHDRTTSDSPGFPPLGDVTGNMDNSKLALHQSRPCTKPTAAMNLDDASNSVTIHPTFFLSHLTPLQPLCSSESHQCSKTSHQSYSLVPCHQI